MRKLVTCTLSLALIFVFTQTTLAVQPLSPLNGDTLNYTHVLFRWHAMPNAEGYLLQIASADSQNPFEDAIILETEVPTYAVEITSGLQWGKTYLWRYISLDDNGGDTKDTSATQSFSISSCPDFYWTFDAVVSDTEKVQAGITIFGIRRRGVLAASDMYGECVWILEGADSDLDQLPNGNMLYGASGVITESDLSGNVTFRSGNIGNHHESDKLANGNYLSMGHVFMDIDDPVYADSSMLWMGDTILELDSDGDTVWSWNAFDHFEQEDYDRSYFTNSRERAYFDWTHGNSAHMTSDGKFIYMSFRHLNRLTLISYPDGDVIWNLGWRYSSGEATHGANVNFNHQHEPEMLENGNILLYDNHNYGPEDSSRALELSIDFNRDTVVQVEWEYWVDSVSHTGGDADRLANGNTLITNTRLQTIIEVTPDGEEVWRLTSNWEHNFIAYRSDRVPGLYPLIYTIEGPSDGHQVPLGESFYHVVVNNIGFEEQEYVMDYSDTHNWFQGRQEFRVAGGDSTVRTVIGYTDNSVSADTISIVIYPISKPLQRDSWTAVVSSNADLSVKGITVQPAAFIMKGVYPNPFNMYTTFNFRLRQRSMTTIRIYDINGRRIRALKPQNLEAGNHSIVWDGLAECGMEAGTGNYFYSLKCEHGEKYGTLQLMR